MAEPKSIEERLATIEEHVRNIDLTLANQVVCRRVTSEGECEFFETVVDHDRKINQWTGALAAVSLVCAMIGGLIGVLLAKVWK